ncbi:hypothetical protein EV368DRAFT_73417 [Lentinula lateritia]|uniref:Uncharacterized protein n=1 Tax=Lentinula aff. lateritia TaxID=2804960 RepID=A0ACC1U0Z2_9AGAR|nr:hypothetical protein F5876DRAFT_41754 [Lentinula aff. lateritia]KAJ3853520.1 hypothetical protein EV368DRAFT_73417 [Lentinula lateritia]
MFFLWSLILPTLIHGATVTFPPTVGLGASDALYTSSASSFDSLKISNVNSTTYEWYYFDAISDDGSYSVVATFFVAPDTAFPFTGSSTMTLEVLLSVQTPDSDVFYLSGAFATDAQVTTDGDGASGVWEGTGLSFNGSSDMSSYEVVIDSADVMGVTGTISMQSIAPAHYPCSVAQAGETMQLMPNVGWANAVPDSQATIQLEINGQNVSFTGSGYHDMNWGDIPFTDAVGTWHWGHGRLGPYSLVWFDGTSQDGTPYASGYVSMNGVIIGAQCSGVNVTASTSGFDIGIDLGDEGVLQAQFSTDHTLLSFDGVYYRWSGSLVGGISDGEQYTGSAMFDEFDFTSS